MKELLYRLETLLEREVLDTGILNLEYIMEHKKKNPSIYLYYPYLFSGCFGITDEKKLDGLSVGGFLYFVNIMHMDQMLDISDKNQIHEFNDKILIKNALVEQSIKIFSGIFEKGSVFWSYWNTRKKEFMSSLKDEASLDYNRFSEQDYFNVAKNKVAFAKAAIDACRVLSGDTFASRYDQLIASHDNFSIACQIMDDIADLRKDLKNNQFNYAVYFARQKGFLEITSGTSEGSLEAFYYEGPAIELYKEALSHLAHAEKELPHEEAFQLWKAVINKKIAECRQKLTTLQSYKILHTKISNLSTDKAGNPLGLDFDARLERAIQSGVSYIIEKAEQDGFWSDFVTQAGVSTQWATSFIGYQLLGIGVFEPELDLVLQRSKRYLHTCTDSLFSFNENWRLIDGDSSNFGILFTDTPSPDAQRIKKWLGFQNVDGGFTTYNDEEFLRKYFQEEAFTDYKGWTASQVCVSAVAAHVLYKYRDAFTEEWKNLMDFLMSKNNPDGSWGSYWWSDNIYSTYFATLLFKKENRLSSDLVARSLTYIKGRQNTNGSFSDSHGENCFYTGLGLKFFLNHQDTDALARKALEYLLEEQYQDGSWPEGNGLQIPHPSEQAPNSGKYKKVKTFGTDIRAYEFQRLFTTSVCINALYSYKLQKDLI